MPIYEYKCETCGKVFEKMESINSESRICICKCGGTASRKISQTSYHLTGNGFYNTDNKAAPCGSGECCSACPAAAGK